MHVELRITNFSQAAHPTQAAAAAAVAAVAVAAVVVVVVAVPVVVSYVNINGNTGQDDAAEVDALGKHDVQWIPALHMARKMASALVIIYSCQLRASDGTC